MDIKDEPIARCSLCNRGTWSTDDINTLYDMIQPDNTRCKGTMVKSYGT